jgi:hypothetical protein
MIVEMISIETLSNFISSLHIMWKGMLGIFIFMGIFYLLIHGLNKLFPSKKEEK